MNNPYSIFELCIDKLQLENPLEYHALVNVDKFEISESHNKTCVNIYMFDYAVAGFSIYDCSSQILLNGTYYTFQGYEDCKWDLIYQRKCEGIVIDTHKVSWLLHDVLHITIGLDFIDFTNLINYVTGFHKPIYSMDFVKHFDFNSRNEYSNRCAV